MWSANPRAARRPRSTTLGSEYPLNIRAAIRSSRATSSARPPTVEARSSRARRCTWSYRPAPLPRAAPRMAGPATMADRKANQTAATRINKWPRIARPFHLCGMLGRQPSSTRTDSKIGPGQSQKLGQDCQRTRTAINPASNAASVPRAQKSSAPDKSRVNPPRKVGARSQLSRLSHQRTRISVPRAILSSLHIKRRSTACMTAGAEPTFSIRTMAFN